MRAAVMDGITIGRPCCKVHDCQESLPSQRAQYCEKHADYSKICVVVDCDVPAAPGFQTCTQESHRKLERSADQSAWFVLRRRLERLRAITLEADDGGSTTAELTEVDADGECPSKPDEGNSNPRARFGRRRTHNEQLVVATCGVVLGRATMFGSEGLAGAAVSNQLHCGLAFLIANIYLTELVPKWLSEISSHTLSYPNLCSRGPLL